VYLAVAENRTKERHRENEHSKPDEKGATYSDISP
jgi:hypothetical protein